MFTVTEITNGTLKEAVVEGWVSKEEAMTLIRKKILLRKAKYPSLSNKALAVSYNEIMILS